MSFRQRFGVILGALALCSALTNSVLGEDRKILPGHVPHGLSQFTPIGQIPATNVVKLAIGVPLRDAAGLDQFLSELYDPASPNYRKYLTPEEFTARFGPTEQAYEQVKQFALANGLTILETHGNRLVLDVAGSATAVQSALHVTLRTYRHPTEGRQFFAPDTEPSVAVDLPVADIEGLSDLYRPHPRLKKANTTTPRSGTGSGGGFLGDDFRHAYASGTSLTGAGQMVGLLQFDGYYARDIAAYAAAAGGGRANIVVQPVLLDGFNGVPTTGANSGNGEVALDIEMAMAMAPGLAKILVFEAGPNGFQNDVLNSMVAHSTVKSLSCSWGWSGGPDTTTDNIFKEMAAQGQSFFNASGDSDAFTPGSTSANAVDDPNGANAPSSSPYIIQVGGTTLTMNGAGSSFSSETVWNWGGGSGSSGGVSSYYVIPAWQANISMTANLGSTSHRNIPDVALTADDVTVYYDQGSVDVFGGTSCAAPLWAGFMALVNEQAANLGNAAPGFINPAVYAIGKGQNTNYSYSACFHDTSSGNNFWYASPASYPAVAGYDLCTGWGTPNGVNLINALAGAGSGAVITTNTIIGSTNGLSISPLTGFAFSGLAGGPFAPASAAFQLTNALAASANWSLISTSSWLKVGITNGTLAGSSLTNIGVNLTAAANALKAGNYSTQLRFTNRTTRVGQKIPVTLLVQQPISISSTQGFTAIGPVGGAFAPSSQTFVLSNASTNAVKYSLIKAVTWLALSTTNGSIPGSGQLTVTVSVSSAAKTLAAAVYTTSVRFTNSAGLIATVPFTLSVGQPIVKNGGFEAGSFSGWTQSGNPANTAVTRGSGYYLHTGLYGAQLGPSGSPGYLSQTLPTVAGQTYRLSLWLRNANGSAPNWFEVQWNGAPIFDLQNLSVRAWTNLQFLVTATSASSVLQLGFQDDPAFFGLDDVSLTPVTVTSTAIKSTVRSADSFHLVWNTTSGDVYQAQYKTNLSQADWINLGSPIAANADTLTVTDTNAFRFSSQRFYRLVALPPP